MRTCISLASVLHRRLPRFCMWFSLFTFLGPGEETVHGSVHGLGLKAQDVEALATHLERTLVLS